MTELSDAQKATRADLAAGEAAGLSPSALSKLRGFVERADAQVGMNAKQAEAAIERAADRRKLLTESPAESDAITKAFLREQEQATWKRAEAIEIAEITKRAGGQASQPGIFRGAKELPQAELYRGRLDGNRTLLLGGGK